jgi:hypothetical protein
MDVERTIDDIEQLREMYEAPDIRPLSASDIAAANRRHDEMLAHSPWFRLWRSYGVCCRTESPVVQLGGGGLTLPRMDVKNGEKESSQPPVETHRD